MEIIQFLRNVNQNIDNLTGLTNNKIPQKSKLKFSNDSIVDDDGTYKTVYTLENNELSLEFYHREELLSKLVIE